MKKLDYQIGRTYGGMVILDIYPHPKNLGKNRYRVRCANCGHEKTIGRGQIIVRIRENNTCCIKCYAKSPQADHKPPVQNAHQILDTIDRHWPASRIPAPPDWRH